MTKNPDNSDGRFQVVTASAGSGKTFRLAFEYLRFALADPAENYKKILAITFTNKATKEMKSRILEAAQSFSRASDTPLSGRNKALWDALLTATNYTPDELKRRSGIFYKAVLHNYSEFYVSTIDSFSQRIIRSFAFELQVPQQFEVDLDEMTLNQKIVNRLLAKVGGENQVISAHLRQISINSLDDLDNTNIKSMLLASAKVMMEDESQTSIDQIDSISQEELMDIYDRIKKKRNELRDRIIELAQMSLDAIRRNNMAYTDFSNKGSSFANTYNKILKNDFEIVKTFIKTMNGEKNWLTGKGDDSITSLKEEITPYGLEIIDKVTAFQEYDLVYKSLPLMFAMRFLKMAYREIQLEENMILINEFNQLISKQVKDQFAPFIYEKLGAKFDYFLIDEFQDTGQLQFYNLVPLLSDSLDKPQAESLIVGDSKQAIYRFKGGDVTQLNRLPELAGSDEDYMLDQHQTVFRNNFMKDILKSNYRSKSNIIDFNNALFTIINENDLFSEHRSIYATQAQEKLDNNAAGFVCIKKYERVKAKKGEELDPEVEEKAAVTEQKQQEVLDILNDARNRNYRWKDIAILCRNKSEISQYAELLKNNNIPGISQEGLCLANETSVALFPVFFAHFLEPGNKIHLLNIAAKMHFLGLLPGDLAELNKLAVIEGKLAEVAKAKGFDFTCLKGISLMQAWDTYCIWLPAGSFSPMAHAYFTEYLYIFMQENGNEYGSFYEWWEQKKWKLFIKSTDSVDGVQLMTIHKAKGLEFELVIMPEADWSFTGKNGEKYWFDIELTDLKPIKRIYGQVKNDVINTDLAGINYENYQKVLLDNLNLLYVATTRAVAELYLLMESPSAIKDGRLTKISQYLQLYLGNSMEYQTGEKTVAMKVKVADVNPNERILNPQIAENASIFIKKRSGTIWSSEKRDKIEYGIIMHRLLQEIKNDTDIPMVISKAVIWGIIPEGKADIIKDKINKIVNLEELRPFFNSANEIKAEQSIITPDGHEYIPDRLWMDKNLVHILDFKTGNQKPEHEKQVRGYASLLRQMGFDIGELLLVYLESMVIVSVNSETSAA